MKLILDAGHGGSDSGACNGAHHEAVYALDIVKRVGKLCQSSGITVQYTRTSDTHVSITKRYQQANTWGADAFVSVHLNSAAQQTASGAETLVYLQVTHPLACAIQQAVIAATGTKNRGVKARPDLGVLRATNMPAVLCEVGFISNPQECEKLASADYRQCVAQALAQGICTWAAVQYCGNQVPTAGTASTQKTTQEDEDMTIYETRAQVPAWAVATVDKLIAKGALQGDGSALHLEHNALRNLVINDRMGLYQ